MALYVFVLAVSIMFAGVQGVSESMSCSMVNGKTICTKETSPGNTAISSSSSYSDPGSSSQSTFAGAGSPGAFQTSGQRVVGGNPSADTGINVDTDTSSFQDTDGGLGGFSGGYTYTSAGSFPPNAGFFPGVGGFGFASAGGFPFPFPIPFMAPGYGNPPQDSSARAAGNPPSDVFNYAGGYVGGFPGAGAFAGVFPFGRR